MSSRRPPAGATWLLEHFIGSGNRALVGDLIEEYSECRSRFWFWREALTAVGAQAFTEMRSHPVITARTLAIGWIVLYGTSHLLRYTPIFPFLLRTLPSSYLFFGFDGLIVWLPTCAFAGWVVSGLDRRGRGIAVLTFSLSKLFHNFRFVSWTCTVAIDSISQRRYLPYLVSNLMSIFLPAACILIGGLLGRAQRELPKVAPSP